MRDPDESLRRIVRALKEEAAAVASCAPQLAVTLTVLADRLLPGPPGR